MAAIFVITFMNKDSVYKTISSDKISFPEIDPTSSEGNFAGWYYDQETTSEASEGAELTEDITLYAKWSDFTATFMANGSVYQKIQGNTLTFPTTDPTKENVKFTGWYYDEDCTNIASVSDVLTKDTTLYPRWNSYITNKLEGKMIYMQDYYQSSSSGWYYVTNETELKNVPLYSSVVVNGATLTPDYPAWVKLRRL